MSQRGGPGRHAGLHGFSRHAGGARDGVNRHATGGADAITAADIGAATGAVFDTVDGASSITIPTATVLATIQAATSHALFPFFVKATLYRGSLTQEGNAFFRVTYTDASVSNTATGTTSAVNSPYVLQLVWSDQTTAGWDIAGVTENLDDVDNFPTSFGATGKSIQKIELFVWATGDLTGSAPSISYNIHTVDV